MTRGATLDMLVDVMRVPFDGDPSVALVKVDPQSPSREVACDVLVVGGGTVGGASAMAEVRHGRRLSVIEETGGIGGQTTYDG